MGTRACRRRDAPCLWGVATPAWQDQRRFSRSTVCRWFSQLWGYPLGLCCSSSLAIGADGVLLQDRVGFWPSPSSIPLQSRSGGSIAVPVMVYTGSPAHPVSGTEAWILELWATIGFAGHGTTRKRPSLCSILQTNSYNSWARGRGS